MSNLLNWSFWFDAYPLPFNQAAYYALGAIFLLAIALGVVSRILKKKSADKLVQAVWSKLASFGFSLGIVGLILAFLKHQRAPYLGMRLWLSLWLLICLAWLVFILKYIFLDIPKIRRAKQAKAEFDKYLPK